MEGTQQPSQIEYLYERYRHLLWWIVVLVAVGFGANYLWDGYQQGKIDASWSAFVTSIGMDEIYVDMKSLQSALVDHLEDKDLAGLEKSHAEAEATQKPFLLLAISRRAMLDRNWDRARKALDELEKEYPEHALVVQTKYPIQVREQKPEEEQETPKPTRQDMPDLKDAREGSMVGMMREQIAKAVGYERPKRFDKIEPAADAPKIKFEFNEEWGSFTIALMTEQAPEQCARFLELAKAGYWVDMNVDELNRKPPEQAWSMNPTQFHVGFASTKDADRANWNKTDPSENQIEFEESGLSHFPGAVAARVGTEDQSCADRFWVCFDDCSSQDGTRVVFAYVVEGLDTVERICNGPMPEQETQQGRGQPEVPITVTAVTVIE